MREYVLPAVSGSTFATFWLLLAGLGCERQVSIPVGPQSAQVSSHDGGSAWMVPDGRIHLFKDDRLPWNEAFAGVEELKSHLDAGGKVPEGKLRFPAQDELTEFSSDDVETLARCRGLRGLSLYRRVVSPAVWSAMREMELNLLVLAECRIEPFGRDDLPDAPIQGLFLVNCKTMTDEQLATLLTHYASTIEVLRVCCRTITSSASEPFRDLARLRELDIYGARFDERILDVLRNVPSLTHLSLAEPDTIPIPEIESFIADRPDVHVDRILLR